MIIVLDTGMEEMYKLQVRLKLLHSQLQEETTIPQEFRSGIDASYELCFTMAHKVEKEMLTLKNNVETLTEDNDQLTKKNAQLCDEIEDLKKQLADRGK